MRSVHDQVAAIAAATLRDRLLIAARRGEPMDRPADQLAALVQAATALAGAGIPYALIGGIAVGIHSETPRATQDVDLAVPASIPRDRIQAAFTGGGFELTGEFPHNMNFQHPGGERLKVAMDQAFDEMIGRAEPLDVEGTHIMVVAPRPGPPPQQGPPRPSRHRTPPRRRPRPRRRLVTATGGPDRTSFG